MNKSVNTRFIIAIPCFLAIFTMFTIFSAVFYLRQHEASDETPNSKDILLQVGINILGYFFGDDIVHESEPVVTLHDSVNRLFRLVLSHYTENKFEIVLNSGDAEIIKIVPEVEGFYVNEELAIRITSPFLRDKNEERKNSVLSTVFGEKIFEDMIYEVYREDTSFLVRLVHANPYYRIKSNFLGFPTANVNKTNGRIINFEIRIRWF